MDVRRRPGRVRGKPRPRLLHSARVAPGHPAAGPGRRADRRLPQVAPNLSFPVANLWRNATGASPPGALFKPGTEEAGDDSDAAQNGVDFLWANCILVINRAGDIIENWTQWDKMLRRPHSVYISPYDRAEERLHRRRLPSCDLQVHQRRQAAAEDDRHAQRARVRRDALLSPDVHGVQHRRQLVRVGRLRQHPRGEVRQERQLRDRLGRARNERRPGSQARDAAELLQQRPRRRRRPGDARGVRE